MAKLAGDAAVYYGGTRYLPGDELPDELKHLGDAADVDPAPASSSTGAAEVNGVAVNSDFDAESATVPQLREELDRLKVEYSDSDRKDALKAKYREVTQIS